MDFKLELERALHSQQTSVSLEGKRILLTGATAGIGLALACHLAPLKPHLLLVGRRAERLKQLADALTERTPGINVEVFCMDLNAPKAVDSLPLDIDVLINNAGLALGKDPIQTAQWSDWQTVMETNIMSLMRLTHRVVPHMVAKKSGHIVSLCSIAGHQAYAGGSVYCASKAALRIFHQALRQELCAYDIRLSLVSPGMVETEFSVVRFKGDTNTAKSVYAGIDPLLPEDIAHEIVHILKSPLHVNVDEVILMPTCQGAATVVHRRHS
jgi:3-hydroxy acid dehydrogenase/malonic semialdehyde reductase